MENSPNSIEMQIDNFLEHFKRSASKAMDSDWTLSASGSNLGKSKSRSSCLDVSELSEMNEGGECSKVDMQDSDLSQSDVIDVVDEVDVDLKPFDIEELRNQDKCRKKVQTKTARTPNKKKTKNQCDNQDTSDEEDKDSTDAVAARLERGCECLSNCFKELDPDKVYKHRLNIAELTKNEHDMYLMGITMASMANSMTTCRQKERQRQRATYIYQGNKVCLDAFLFLENVSLYHIKRIRNHVLVHGVTPRTHGNFGKKAHNAFSLDVYRNVEDYLRKYLKPFVNDFSKNQVLYGINRSDIYYSYRHHGRKPDEKLMGYSTFRHFMREQFPQIKFQKIDYSGKHGVIAETITHKSRKNTKPIKECRQENPLKIVPGNLSLSLDVSSGVVIEDGDQSVNEDKQSEFTVIPMPFVRSENFPINKSPNAC